MDEKERNEIIDAAARAASDMYNKALAFAANQPDVSKVYQFTGRELHFARAAVSALTAELAFRKEVSRRNSDRLANIEKRLDALTKQADAVEVETIRGMLAQTGGKE